MHESPKRQKHLQHSDCQSEIPPRTTYIDSAAGHGVEATVPYYERQHEAWCGMHVINNYLQGPFATKDCCRAAVKLVCRELSQAGGEYTFKSNFTVKKCNTVGVGDLPHLGFMEVFQ